MGVSQLGATDHDQIKLLISHHSLRSVRIVDAPTGRDCNLYFSSNSLSDRSKERLSSPRHLPAGNDKVDAHFEQIQAANTHAPHQLDGLCNGLLVLPVVLYNAKANGQRETDSPGSAFNR
ncbi:TPA: hypothetical protein SL218_004571 [Pseudomonas aeruginosa]|nr:hypothetical protein [Pseudomonas aeruginosa]